MKKMSKLFFRRKLNGIITLGILALVLIAIFAMNLDSSQFSQALNWLCVEFRGPVTIFCIFCVLLCMFLVFSKYGSIKIGGPDAKTEMSTFSWLSCLFMTGCGIGIVFYCQEPILHLHDNPYYGNVSGDAVSVAYSLTLFNWTINAWVQYAVLGVILAYFYFNMKRDLRLSSILPASSTPKWVKHTVDIIMALGVIAGLTTSLGLGVSQIEKGLSYAFGIDISPYVLIVCIAAVAAWSVTSGVQKGIKWLSTIGMVLVILLLTTVLSIGVFKLDINGFVSYIAKGTGLLFSNFIAYNDFWDSTSDAWAASYPIFFDLWFAAWAAFVAVFVARISKGRTIREFILGVLWFPTLFTIIWFGIFGRVGVEYSDMIYQTMANDVPTALFIFLKQVAGSGGFHILSALVIIVICMFFITSSDSGSLVVATLLGKGNAPTRKDRMFWATIQCVVAVALFWGGGLALVQSVSVIMGILVILLMFLGSLFFVFLLVKNNKEI